VRLEGDKLAIAAIPFPERAALGDPPLEAIDKVPERGPNTAGVKVKLIEHAAPGSNDVPHVFD